FQETYHRDTYSKVHLSGKKRDFDWRITAMDRAMLAGIDDVGIGVLFGLYDWRFELLALLATKPGKVFKRDEIMKKIWGEDIIVGDRTLDVHIRKIREKIGDNYISTLKGVGYKFEF
ncbi:MAG TPA: winged helix-turn-helix domain-containing protein, partial [Saprospiraceae bacterium]|nr:winged helix-turn-helix domain-containing protein [Saprospiraceae bacterium]